MRRVHYVHVFNKWVQRGASGRWSVGVWAGDTPERNDNVIAIYEVECATRAEAVPTVMAWLARGRPQAMGLVRTVVET